MILTHDFSNDLDYTKENAVLSGGKGILSFVNNPAQTFQEDFANDTGFTYDSDKVEFVGGVLKQKDQRNGALFGANYSINENANWAAGSALGTLVNGSVTGGWLDLLGDSLKYCDYSAINNLGTQKGCIRFRVQSGFNSTPSSVEYLFTHKKSTSSTAGQLSLYLTTSSDLIIYAKDSAGETQFSTILGKWYPTVGSTYVIEVDYDFDAGATRVFINGSQIGATINAAFSRGTGVDVFRVGSNWNATGATNFKFDDLLLFDAVQHTANHSYDYTVEDYIYLASTVNLPTMNYSGLGEIQSVDNITKIGTNVPDHSVVSDADSVDIELTFLASNTVQQDISNLDVEYTGQKYSPNGYFETNNYFDASVISSIFATITESGNNKVYFVMKRGSDYLYFDGASWVASDKSISQSNTKTEIETNISSLLTDNQRCKIYIILVSEDGSETPSIDEITITYIFGGLEPSEGNMARIFGYVKDLEENPIEDATVTIEINIDDDEYCEAAGKIMSKKVVKTTNDDGYFYAYLPWTSEFDSTGIINYKISVVKTDVISITKKDGEAIEFTIPDDTDEINLTDRISMAT